MNTVSLNVLRLNTYSLNSNRKSSGKEKIVNEWSKGEIESIEWSRLYVDANDYILYGVREDGYVFCAENLERSILSDIMIFEKKYK